MTIVVEPVMHTYTQANSHRQAHIQTDIRLLSNVSLSICQSVWAFLYSRPTYTRKLSYRKDDRAMRSIYGYPENSREPVSTPTATFDEIFNGLLFQSIPKMWVQNLQFVTLPISDIIGRTQKMWANIQRLRFNFDLWHFINWFTYLRTYVLL